MSGHFSSLVAAGRPVDGRVPVTVLTGFLGSGKTTLLNQLLHEPDLQGIAVIVNEFGEIGIDHDLIAQTTEDTILLANGCMCCAVRGDLIGALAGLAERGSGDGPALRQVMIETSGLADPAPILRTLMGEPAVKDRFMLAGVCCRLMPCWRFARWTAVRRRPGRSPWPTIFCSPRRTCWTGRSHPICWAG
jgi:hypothetical protein